MQRVRRRVKRQRNEAPKSAGCYHFEAPMSDIEASLECQEGPFTLGQSPNSSHMDRQSSDASTSTAGPLMPLPSVNLQYQESALWGQYIRQVYIGNSHCPIDGWYQACRVCNSWTAGELDVAGKAVPLCRGCQHKCHSACTKVGTAGPHPSNSVAATSTALLALDRAWEEYLNKLRLDNGMLVTR